MKTKTHLFLLAFLIFSYTSLFAAPSCKQFEVNSTQSNPAYRQPHYRSLEAIQAYGSKSLIEHLETPGIRLLDSGGGYGLAGLELSLQPYNSATVINSQHFWAHFKESLIGVKQFKETDANKGPNEPTKINGIPFPVIVKLSSLMKEKVYSHADFIRSQNNPLLKKQLDQHLARLVEKLENHTNFKYLPGFSENVLQGVSSSFDVILDFYGAFFYSPNRLHLLQNYWKKLAPGGAAYIVLGSYNWVNDPPPPNSPQKN